MENECVCVRRRNRNRDEAAKTRSYTLRQTQKTHRTISLSTDFLFIYADANASELLISSSSQPKRRLNHTHFFLALSRCPDHRNITHKLYHPNMTQILILHIFLAEIKGTLHRNTFAKYIHRK